MAYGALCVSREPESFANYERSYYIWRHDILDFGGNRRWNTETLKVRIGNAMQAALTVQINYDALIEVFD